MHWRLSNRADPRAVALADRHYSRQKPGTSQFVAPGRCLVLAAPAAVWVTSWPKFVQHEFTNAWVCSMFRNDGAELSSELIREAVAATRWRWPEVPEGGMVTFVDAAAVRPKRDPGYCFHRAGFVTVGRTKSAGLHVLTLHPGRMPEPAAPSGQPEPMFDAQAAVRPLAASGGDARPDRAV